MATLTVTGRGQVTFRKDVLKHVGIEPGGKLEWDLLPDGRATLKAARPAVDAGLIFLEGGGNFADGVVAHEGRWLECEVFLFFDKNAVALLTDQKYAAGLLR